MTKRHSGKIRASISFPADVYASLEQVARQKKVSLAWVVRDATEKYIGDRPTRAKGQQRSKKRLFV